MEISNISFLALHKFEDDTAIRGAILVTDRDTKPIEFRVTAPVRPEKFQKILYGELLDEHISVELIGLPLLDSLEQNPDVVITQHHLFLGMNDKHEVPTLLMLKEDESTFKKGIATRQLNLPNSTVKIATTLQIDRILDEMTDLLQEIFTNRNLMEPFERLKSACTDIHARKLGDR